MGFREEIVKRVDKAKDLPSLPGVFLKLDKIISDKNSSATDIAVVMKDDISLTTKVLRVANSVAFAGSTQVTSVTQAVTRLGFRQLADLAKSLSMLALFKGGGVIDPKTFWLHSLSVAYVSDILPKYLGRTTENKDSLFTAGLLHDIGIFVMELFTGDLYQSIVTMAADTGKPLIDVERKFMQIDHAEVGGLVLRKWGIPELIADAAAKHHAPFSKTEGTMPFADIIQIANLVCNDHGVSNGTGTVLSKLTESQWTDFGFQVADLPALKEEVQKIIDRCANVQS